MTVLRTRFAPTPSGFLHAGNAAHVLLLRTLAERGGWEIALRIDDADSERFRPEYVDDIFDLLEWLEVDCAVGPADPQELSSQWSQRHREALYKEALLELQFSGAPVYVCACSRAQWAAHMGPGCPQGCTDLALVTGETSLRMIVEGSETEREADAVLWRRDGVAGYHLLSIIDDDFLAVTHVVRGADLRASTRVQGQIARWLPRLNFHTAEVLLHPIIEDEAGHKLSKSAGAQAAPMPRTQQMREHIEILSSRLLSGLEVFDPH